MPTTSSNSIRKAAILLRQLGADEAAVLLAQLSADEARAIRSAIRALGDVTDEERASVASELRVGTQTTESSALAGGVELDLHSAPEVTDVYTAAAHHEAPAPPPSSASPAPQRSTLASLEDADAPTLAAYLQREQPRTIAVVLSQLSPQRAAAVLGELPAELRSLALECLADLGETDAYCLEVLAANVSQWIERHRNEQTRQASRLATIETILAASGEDCRAEVLDSLKQRGCSWAETLLPIPVESPPMDDLLADVSLAGDEEAEPDVVGSEEVAVAEFEEELPPVEVEPPPTPPLLPFAALAKLDPSLLAQVMRRTPPRQLLLAIAGGDERLQRRIESLLPKKQIKQLRKRLLSLGEMHLREIEAAQLAMAYTASDLWIFLHKPKLSQTRPAA